MPKTKSSGKKQTKKGLARVDKLAVNKDSIKDVPGKEQRKIKGGQVTPYKKPMALLISE